MFGMSSCLTEYFFQLSEADYITKLIEKRMLEFSNLASLLDESQSCTLRTQRAFLDAQRHEYDSKSTQSEKQLIEVEAAVDELRNEVVERRYIKQNLLLNDADCPNFFVLSACNCA